LSDPPLRRQLLTLCRSARPDNMLSRDHRPPRHGRRPPLGHPPQPGQPDSFSHSRAHPLPTQPPPARPHTLPPASPSPLVPASSRPPPPTAGPADPATLSLNLKTARKTPTAPPSSSMLRPSFRPLMSSTSAVSSSYRETRHEAPGSAHHSAPHRCCNRSGSH